MKELFFCYSEKYCIIMAEVVIYFFLLIDFLKNENGYIGFSSQKNDVIL